MELSDLEDTMMKALPYGFYIEWDKLRPLWRNDIHYWLNRINVIGSIIDNPELLELEVQDEAD